MHNEDKNLAYLVKMMRKKYGRRDNLFKIQQRLAARVQQPGERLSDFAASLNNIGFGKRVPMEYYIEAFINGIINQTAAMQVRAYEPQTLDEAVQFAMDTCGAFGEGYKVTDWRVAKRRYRDDRDGEDDDAQPARKKTAAAEISDALDWEKLGLGFGGDSGKSPSFDTEGKVVSGLVETAKKDPLSLAALQALMVVAGIGKYEALATKGASGKAKVARAREVKAEDAGTNNYSNQQPQGGVNRGALWQDRGSSDYSNNGCYGNNGGYGGGRGAVGGRGYGRGRGTGGMGDQGTTDQSWSGNPSRRGSTRRRAVTVDSTDIGGVSARSVSQMVLPKRSSPHSSLYS
ncbi:unnamed protein product [Phytophthora fragariaefolia]|uniref:Unnamed protein product n=1 Tax=Phytophthora fragariaefolia TaxID=1490495 RepID=A0A9W6Y7S3_9STRA|nr:unnamed protein product [Phytophthora fragariaefolia]